MEVQPVLSMKLNSVATQTDGNKEYLSANSKKAQAPIQHILDLMKNFSNFQRQKSDTIYWITKLLNFNRSFPLHYKWKLMGTVWANDWSIMWLGLALCYRFMLLIYYIKNNCIKNIFQGTENPYCKTQISNTLARPPKQIMCFSPKFRITITVIIDCF